MNIQIDVLFEPVYSLDFSYWEPANHCAYKKVKVNADITQLIEQFGEELFVTLNKYNSVVVFSKNCECIKHISAIADKFGYDTYMEADNCISFIGDDCVHSGFTRVDINGRNANCYLHFSDLFIK